MTSIAYAQTLRNYAYDLQKEEPKIVARQTYHTLPYRLFNKAGDTKA
jgi:hypothetical protein